MPPLISRKQARLPLLFTAAAAALAGLLWLLVWQGSKESTTYSPRQPIPFSHATHAGKLGIDCMACHHTAAQSQQAGLPDAASCLACHRHVLPGDARLAPLHASANPDAPNYTGEPLAWVRVNPLPGFAHFDHAAHVNRGVSCAACHGDMRTAERTSSSSVLTMASCLDCHHHPRGIVPLEQITSPASETEGPAAAERSAHLIRLWNINPGTNCATCHH